MEEFIMIENSVFPSSANKPASLPNRPTVRIIQITESWGGMEYNNTQLAIRLVQRGIPVSITTVGARAYSRMPERYARYLQIEEIPWSLERLPSFWEWYRLMRARPADIAVFPKNWYAKGGIAMMAAAGLVYDRVVAREHVPVPPDPQLPRKRHLGFIPGMRLWHYRKILHGRLLSAVPDKVICCSQVVRDRLVTETGFPASKTATVHNGVNCDVFRSDAVARARYREEIGIPSTAIVFGAVGRLDNGTKRHDLSLRLFARLVADYPDEDLRFLLVGDGADRESLLQLAEGLHVASRLCIAPFTPEPWEAYNALDVFLLPSAFEAFGLALAEAMAAERCVVGMVVDGVAEILNEDEAGIGFAVPKDDTDAFYAAMRQALALGPDGRADMGARARESVKRRFDADQQYEKIIAHVVGMA